ncbi:MAG TPA: efflux RND transporter periplasmic adaptor subunit, partial [Polyangiaceae bacterium]|nr:efflux RND transporter periplasmic adaptor subunit [Polyangiaceae bacterium]
SFSSRRTTPPAGLCGSSSSRWLRVVLPGLLSLVPCVMAACKGRPGAPHAPPPVEVGVVALQPESVVLTTELPGRTSAYETSEVRPQVSGLLRARLFTEGQIVHQGQTLYQIDDRLYRAAEEQARANLQSAIALNEAAQIKAQHYATLAKQQAVAELDYAEARASAAQAAASIQQARAALDTARINLRFTQVPAPITGRIGRSLSTTGALVTEGQASPLAVIQRLDPIFVDLQQSSAELLALRSSLERAGNTSALTDVRLRLPDGSEYPTVGHLQFAEPVVDPSTGSVTLRARFDNPDHILLPGMYVRAIVGQARAQSVILAPQAGVTHDPKGNATALVVAPGNKVERRTLEADRAVGDRWLVQSGLSAGDRLIVEGTDKVRPGQVVRAEPAPAPPASEAPSPSGAGTGGAAGSVPPSNAAPRNAAPKSGTAGSGSSRNGGSRKPRH